MARDTWLRLLSVFGPILLLVVVMRLLQYSITIHTGAPPLGSILLSAALTPLLLLLLSTAIYALLRVRWPRPQPIWHFIAVILLTALLMIATSVFAPAWTTEWISPGAFEAIRWDVLMLLVLALAFLFLLERTRGWVRIASLTVLYALTPPLMFLPAATFGYFVSTGSPADVTLLKYFLLHLSDLAIIISSELHGIRVFLLFLPLLILVPPLFLLRVPMVRRWAYPSTTKKQMTGAPWHVLWGALPVVLLLALPPRTALPSVYPPSSYVSLMHGLVANASDGSGHIQRLLQEGPPPFDTRSMRLVATDSTRRMNVVIILLESTRARSVTPYTPSLNTTPFLDSLAQHALLVDQMYAVVPYTNKSLTPLLAGIYPFPHREIVEARPGGIPGPGLPDLLKPYGYRSAFFTPATLAYERKDRILQNLGFDHMQGDDSFDKEGFAKTNYFGHEDRIVLAPSMAWVDERIASDEPFFLTYLTMVAHHPYTVPPSFEQHDFGVEDPALNEYLNAVRYTDAFLRDLFRAFEERQLLDNTLFVITGDHGQAFGEHQQRMHADVLWDETLHIPTLIYNRVLFPKAGRIAEARQQVDILPTVAEALGFMLEDGSFPGSSLLQPAPPGRTLYFSGWDSDVVLAFRQNDMKFICRYLRCSMQVFDVGNDPLELNNIAEHLSPERLRAAELQLLLWRHSVEKLYEEHVP
ncbi:MAG: LTA synthase family protein [Rhodothermales bacterium]